LPLRNGTDAPATDAAPVEPAPRVELRDDDHGDRAPDLQPATPARNFWVGRLRIVAHNFRGFERAALSAHATETG
jgi:hypothetical protein